MGSKSSSPLHASPLDPRTKAYNAAFHRIRKAQEGASLLPSYDYIVNPRSVAVIYGQGKLPQVASPRLHTIHEE